MRVEGRPPESTVASVMAFGSGSFAERACSNQVRKRSSGSRRITTAPGRTGT